MRVHALAKLLERTSREVVAALAELGVEVRSAQSSIERDVAQQVVAALAPTSAEPAAAEPAATEVSVGAAADDAADDAGPDEAPLAPVFAPPTPLFRAPTPVERAEPAADAEPAGDEAADGAEEPTDEDAEGGTRRRRRRGRRGRGRGRGGEGGDEAENGQDEQDEQTDATAEPGAAQVETETEGEGEGEDAEGDDDAEAETGTRRRRRRRRRRSADDSDDGAKDGDPPNTVTRVRQPRESRDDGDDKAGDGVQGVRGSTRLEAKRQRRRDGRDAGRRRVPILSEAEFLARRESVDRSMVVRQRGDRVEIGVLEDDVLVEHFVTGGNSTGPSLVGNIYLGRVQNVLPSMEAAFVDIGRGRNAVLYAGEVDWDAAGLGGKARRIEQALGSGDSVLVQVTKDPIGHKGARLTTQISLAGRFLVYVPSGGAAGISRKLPDVERKRLKDMLREIVPSEAGVIIRTASEGVSQEALERDVRRLQAQWEVVKSRSEATGPNKPKAPALLYEEPDLLIKVVRDHFNEDFSRLVVSGDDAWDTVSNYVGHVAPELVDRLHRHIGPEDVFAEYRIDEQLLKALDRKVWLPSGGTLVIDRTEAMTVIDVNTGKFTGAGGNLEETVTRNNLEAAEEVVRQLRLRDIGGIIVIDFIDMVLEANRELVLRRLTECLARDRTRHQVAEVTSLGLVQMTRKRVGGGLLEHFSTVCEHCRGRGVQVAAEPVVEPTGTGRGPERDASSRRSRTGRLRPAPAPRPQPPLDRDVHDEVEEVVVERDVVAQAQATRADVAGQEPGPAEPAAVEAVAGEPEPTTRQQVSADAVDARPVDTAPAAAELVTPQPVGAEPVGAEPAGAEPAAAEEAQVAEPAVPASSPVDSVASGVDSVASGVASGQGGTGLNGYSAPGPRPRRGRVTRTAGAPTATAGESPVAAVVTVPVDTPAAEPAPAPGVPPQPEPTVVSRPRRVRRAASRPAGPPAEAKD
jgi:ribonuclease E